MRRRRRGPQYLRRGGIGITLMLCSTAIAADGDAARRILQWRQDWPGVRVKVPLEVLRRYAEQMLSPAPPASDAPLDLLLSRLDLQAAIDGDLLSLRTSANLVLFDAADSPSVRLLPAAVAWNDIRINGKPQSLREYEGWLCLDVTPALLESVEAKSLPLRLEIAALADLRGRKSGDARRIDLPLPDAAQAVLRVDSDSALEVRSARAPLAITGTAEQGTHGEVALLRSETSDFSISWQPPQPLVQREGQPLYETWLVWNLGEGVQEVRAQLDVRIVGGERDALRLRFPAGADRISVSGPDVRETRVSGSSAQVHLNGRIGGATRLNAQFALPWPAGKGRTALSGFGIDGGRPSGGALAVTSGAGGVVLPEETEHLDELGVWQTPSLISAMTTAPVILAYSVTGDWRLGVDVVSLSELPIRETLIDRADYSVLLRPDGSVMQKVRLTVRNRNRQYLRMAPPAGRDLPPQLIMARVSDKPVPVSITPDGAWLVPLDKSVQTIAGALSFTVELVFLQRDAELARKGRFSMELPRMDVPVAQAFCTLYVPEGLHADEWRGAFALAETLGASVDVMEYGRGHETGKLPVQPAASGLDMNLVAESRLKSALEALGRGELTQAEELAAKVVQDQPQAPSAEEARKLLAHIPVLKGRRKAVGREERVAAQQALEVNLEATEDISSRQQDLLSQGWQNVQSGNQQAAADAFRAAEFTGRALAETAEGKQRQDALLADSRKWLENYESLVESNLKLRAEIARGADVLESGSKIGKWLTQSAPTAGPSLSNGPHSVSIGGGTTAAGSGIVVPVHPEVTQPSANVSAAGQIAEQRAKGFYAGTFDRFGPGVALEAENAELAAAKERLDEVGRTMAEKAELGKREALAEVKRAKSLSSDVDSDRISHEQRATRQQQVAALFEQAHSEFAKGKYDSAMALTDRILELDPDNSAATDLRSSAREALRTQSWAFAYTEERPSREDERLRLREKLIWPDAVTQYPAKDVWGEITADRVLGLPISSTNGPEPLRAYDVSDFVSGEAEGKELAEFIARNYKASSGDAAGGRIPGRGAEGPSYGSKVYFHSEGNQIVSAPDGDFAGQVVAGLRANQFQKVPFNSRALQLDPDVLAQLGVRWNGMENGRWATVDEGMLNALLAVEQRQRPVGSEPYRALQEIVPGTSVFLSNSARLSVDMAGDLDNRLLVNGATVNLPHEQVLLVDVNGDLLALRGGATQFWTEAPKAPEIREALPEIDVPAVGTPVRFEKSLVGPDESLAIGCVYHYKEAGQ